MTAPPFDPADEELAATERRRALRLLLSQPFLTDQGPDPETFGLVRRHQPWLVKWFGEQMGYRLTVEPQLARLYKRPAAGARPRAARTSSRETFDARRYALFCLVLAALERVEVQTVLSELAEQVQVLAASEEGVRRFDLERFAERHAFVDAVRLLVSLGVLARADGDEQRFLHQEGDVLYDVDNRRLGRLLAAPQPPSLAESPEDLLAEVYPETDEGANRALRHGLMRRLVEEPVLYLADLSEAERAYLASQRPFLVSQAQAASGLTVEVRQEGLALIDPTGVMTDVAFPGTGTAAHAALLLAGFLAARGRAAGVRVVVSKSELEAELLRLQGQYGKLWAKSYAEQEGLGRLLAEALDRLVQMGLVTLFPEGVEPRPAIARFEPAPPRADGEEDHG